MTFKNVWFGQCSRNGLSFLVADFFPECNLTCLKKLAIHGLQEACGALMGLTLLLSVTPNSNVTGLKEASVRISH